jgi:hypothetical protein
MILAALSWPDAVVRATLIASIALVLAVLIWSIFRTGQIAIKGESREHEGLRRQVQELTARLEQSQHSAEG